MRLFLVVLLGQSLAQTLPAAFSIDGVMFPTNSIIPPEGVSLRVEVSTPSLGAQWYQPARITRNATNVLVDLYPTDGQVLPAVDHLTATVNLGALTPGVYRYEVRLHPGYGTGNTPAPVEGRLTVLPALQILRDQAGVVLRWPAPTTNMVLHTVSQLSSTNHWEQVPSLPDVIGSHHVLTNDLKAPQGFFWLR